MNESKIIWTVETYLETISTVIMPLTAVNMSNTTSNDAENKGGQRVVEGMVSFSLKMQFWFGNEQKYEIYLFYVIEILYIFQEW